MITLFLICLVSAIIGTIIGIFPGISPSMIASIIFPYLLSMPVEHAVIILTSLLYGSQYSGSTGAILFNVSGENASVLTALDGHELAKQGNAKLALLVSAVSSFIGSLLSLISIMLFSYASTKLIIEFTPKHYIMILTISLIFLLALNIKKTICVLLGLVLFLLCYPKIGIVGSDKVVDVTMLTICLFGLSDVIIRYIQPNNNQCNFVTVEQINPNIKELNSIILSSIRGGLIGIFALIPGLGHTVLASIAYNFEQLICKNTQNFGKGSVKGIASIESCNNSASQNSFISLFIFGIPTGAISGMAIELMRKNDYYTQVNLLNHFPNILISILIINIILVLFNYPMATLWAKLLNINNNLLNVIILVLCLISLYTINANYIAVLCITMTAITFKYFKFDTTFIFIGFIFSKLFFEFASKV